MKKGEPTFQLGVCSFCENPKVQPVIQAVSGKVSICLSCTHDSSVAIGIRPIDCVTCYKCRSHNGFTARYINPVASATFQYNGNDADGIATYVLVETDRNWKSELKPSIFTCNNCTFAVAPDMVFNNPYLTPFFKKHLVPRAKKRKS